MVGNGRNGRDTRLGCQRRVPAPQSEALITWPVRSNSRASDTSDSVPMHRETRGVILAR
jgi:hypothetical protein